MASIEALLGVLRASDYGARGGGNRDDAPGIIQALAIAAVAGGAAPLGEGQNLTGGIVTLDPGVLYRIGRTVNIPSNVELVIPTGAIVRAAPGFAGAMFAATNAAGLRVTGGGIVDGNRAGGAVADPFVFTNCADGNLDGPIIQGGNTDGVTLTGCTRMQIEVQSQANGRHGVYHNASTFCGGTILARDNGQRVAGSGVAFDGASTDSSYQLVATDTRAGGAKTQQYGFFEVPASGCDRNVLTASSLTGNALGTQSVVGGASGYVAGAPAVGTVTDATVAAGGLSNAALGATVARINLAINSHFALWQRGNGPFTTSGSITADRWGFFSYGGTATLSVTKDTTNQESGPACAALVFVAGTHAITFQQAWGLETSLLLGRTITATYRVRTATANAVRPFFSPDNGATFVYGAYHPGGGAYQTLSLTYTVPAGATNLYVGLSLEASATIYVDSAPLQEGTVAADYKTAPPALDSLLALRYYSFVGGDAATETLEVGQCTGAANAWGALHYPEKGGVPSITISAPANFNVSSAAGGAIAVTAISANSVGRRSANWTLGVAAGLVAGNATELWASTTSGRISVEWAP